MARNHGLTRRAFLKNAGGAAAAGAAAAASGSAAADLAGGRFDFDTPYNRFGTNCVKFDQQVRTYGTGSVRFGMGIADMDFQAAPAVTRALAERLKHENWGYLDMTVAEAQMAEAIVGWNRRRYGVVIDPASIELATGVHAALISALQTFSPRGSRVLFQAPVYDGFYTDLRFTGTRPEESPLLQHDGKFSMDFEDFERRIGHDTNTFVLCNPHNPTGNCWSAEDLQRIGEICLRRRVLVLADEIHCDFVSKGQKFVPFASVKNRAVVDNSITFHAASKTFGLAAHKVGWFHSTNPELMARVRANHRSDLTTLGIVASHAALTGGEEWLDQLAAYIDKNHDFVQDYLSDRLPLLAAKKPEGTYLVWLDVTRLAERIGARDLAREARSAQTGTPELTPEKRVERFLVKNAGVQLNAGSNYGPSGANHMRMNIATSRRQIELALNSIVNGLKGI